MLYCRTHKLKFVLTINGAALKKNMNSQSNLNISIHRDQSK